MCLSVCVSYGFILDLRIMLMEEVWGVKVVVEVGSSCGGMV